MCIIGEQLSEFVPPVQRSWRIWRHLQLAPVEEQTVAETVRTHPVSQPAIQLAALQGPYFANIVIRSLSWVKCLNNNVNSKKIVHISKYKVQSMPCLQ